jgi:hypothetical protein
MALGSWLKIKRGFGFMMDRLRFQSRFRIMFFTISAFLEIRKSVPYCSDCGPEIDSISIQFSETMKLNFDIIVETNDGSHCVLKPKW